MDTRTSRTKVKLSQSRLARLAGVSRFKLVLYELGEGTLTREEEERIRHAIRDEAGRIRNSLRELETMNDPIGSSAALQ